MSEKVKKPRGFASMTPEKRRAIATLGGSSVPAEKRSFSRNTDLAAEAGRKGGKAVPPTNRQFSLNPILAKTAGKKGGLATQKAAAKIS